MSFSFLYDSFVSAVQFGALGATGYYVYNNRDRLYAQATNPENLNWAGQQILEMGQETIASSVKWVLAGYVMTAATQLLRFAPPIYIPGISMGEFDHGGFKFGETSFGDVTLPKIESADFAKGLRDVGQAIGESGAIGMTIIGSVALSLFAVYGAQKIAIEYLKKYCAWLVGQPTLTRKFKFDDFYARVYNAISAPLNLANRAIYGKKVEEKKPVPIFDPELCVQIREIAQSIKSIKENNGVYTNLLLWGPPGTGKTMTAEALALEAGVNYIEISGGDLAKFIGSNKSPVALLDDVFRRIENSNNPVVIFIDEIDAVGLERSQLDPARVEILNALLNKIGSPSKKVMVIGATNLPSQLDSALLNRFDERLHMGPPKDPERKAMIEMYADYFFDEPEDREIFTEELVNSLSKRLDGQTGRTIYKIMNKCKIRKTMRPENRLTSEIVEQVVGRFEAGQDLLEEEMKKATHRTATTAA